MTASTRKCSTTPQNGVQDTKLAYPIIPSHEQKERHRGHRDGSRKLLRVAVLAICVLGLVSVVKRCGESMPQPIDYEIVTVRSGDTLWGIASEFCPESKDIRDYIRAVCRENGIGSTIYAGDTIRVPVYAVE